MKLLYLDKGNPEVDLAKVLELVHEVEFEEELAPKNPRKIAAKVIKWFEAGSVFVAKTLDSDEIVGIMLVSADEMWWGDETFLTNAVLYIQPEYRSFNLFKRFIQTAEKYAKIKGCRFLPSLSFVKDHERKTKLLKRLGYDPILTAFRKI